MKVNGIEIAIKHGHKIVITVAEARELYEMLEEIFGSRVKSCANSEAAEKLKRILMKEETKAVT